MALKQQSHLGVKTLISCVLKLTVINLSFSENPHSSCHEGGELPSSQVLPLSGLVHPSEGRSSQADAQSVLRGRQRHLPAQPRWVSGCQCRKQRASGAWLQVDISACGHRNKNGKEKVREAAATQQYWTPDSAAVFHCRGIKWEWRAWELGFVTDWMLRGLTF